MFVNYADGSPCDCWAGQSVPAKSCNGALTLTKNLLIGRIKVLFAFVYKQSMLTSSGCYVTITVMVTVNKYNQNIITTCKWSLGQGNMFTGVCLSTGEAPGPRGLPVPGGECLVETLRSPTPEGYCCERYTSYWNAFLLIYLVWYHIVFFQTALSFCTQHYLFAHGTLRWRWDALHR